MNQDSWKKTRQIFILAEKDLEKDVVLNCSILLWAEDTSQNLGLHDIWICAAFRESLWIKEASLVGLNARLNRQEIEEKKSSFLGLSTPRSMDHYLLLWPASFKSAHVWMDDFSHCFFQMLFREEMWSKNSKSVSQLSFEYFCLYKAVTTTPFLLNENNKGREIYSFFYYQKNGPCALGFLRYLLRRCWFLEETFQTSRAKIPINDRDLLSNFKWGTKRRYFPADAAAQSKSNFANLIVSQIENKK